jgi:hypothetical protein
MNGCRGFGPHENSGKSAYLMEQLTSSAHVSLDGVEGKRAGVGWHGGYCNSPAEANKLV